MSKISSLCETKYDDDPTEEPDDESDPVISVSTIPHRGAVNRIRVIFLSLPFLSQCLPNRSQVVGVWSETGVVSIYNIASQLSQVEKASTPASGSTSSTPVSLPSLPTDPVYQFKGHRTEGYALDWSLCEKGLLATGDCAGLIHITSPVEGGWTTDATPFQDHADSVEDLQWSPSESTVFASCSVDRTVRIWDTRNPSRRSMLTVQAHDSDVNVLNWNK